MSSGEHPFHNLFDAVYTLDRQWRFTYLNPQAEKLVQRSNEELIGKVAWEEFPEAVVSPTYTYYHEALEKQKTVRFEEYYPLLKTWFETTVYPSSNGLTIFFR